MNLNGFQIDEGFIRHRKVKTSNHYVGMLWEGK